MHSVRGSHPKSLTIGPLTLLGLGAVARATDARDYNLQFVIIQISEQQLTVSRGGPSRIYYRGSGYANIRNGQFIEGVHFEFTECEGNLVSSTPEERALTARWIKERERLAVIYAPSKRPEECKLRVPNMDGVVYRPDRNGISVKAYTPQQYAQLPPRKMTLTPTTPTAPTIEILPLTVSILDATWQTVLGE